MAAEKKETKKVEIDVEAIASQVNSVAAVVRKVVAVLERQFGIDIDRDGKIGNVRLAILFVLCGIFAVSSLFAGVIDRKQDTDSSRTAIYTLTGDGDGTGSLAVVGTISATEGLTGATTGDLNADDINATGANTDSLGINVNAATNLQTATISVVTENASNQVADTMFIKYNLLEGPNDLNGTTDYAYLKARIDDTTATTEDGAIVLGVEVNSTATDVLTVDASGATVTGTLLTSVGLDAVGDVDLDYGSADVDDHTFITDGTGDAEIVLPADSIGEAEVDWANITKLQFDGGTFDIVNTTQLVFIAGAITNVIDVDITN